MSELEKLQDQNKKLEAELARVTRISDSDEINVTSLVSHRDRIGIVQLNWGNKVAQLPVNDARDLAVSILKCAEAAESDAFLIGFLTQNLKSVNEEGCYKLLAAFREYREERKRKDYLPR